MRRGFSMVFLAGCSWALAAPPAVAELTVTVNISGPIDELLPVLEYLRQQGAGPGGSSEENPLKVEVHSVHGAETEQSPAEAAASAPQLTLTAPKVEPGTLNPGSPVVIQVGVSDTQKVVDTVTARLVEANLEVDLFDNGMNGDKTAGDGTWSAYVLAPEDLAAGTYTIDFAAYDLNGAPLQIPGPDGTQTPVAAQTQLEAVRSEAPAPPAAPPATPPAAETTAQP